MHLKILFSFLLLFIYSSHFAQANEEEIIPKTIYHCDFYDDNRFNIMLATILHQIEYYNENLIEHEMKVVVNGECTKYISTQQKDQKFLKAIESRVKNYGVEFFACKTGMKASGVKESDTAKFVELVPNGAAKITELQQKGFAYIKVQ